MVFIYLLNKARARFARQRASLCELESFRFPSRVVAWYYLIGCSEFFCV
jgi:hypothetical protein